MIDNVRTAGARKLALVTVATAIVAAMFSASGFAATYSHSQTLPVPPASSFQASAGGDGWSVALSNDKVYNVFHHNNQMTVQCHLQADATPCWPSGPITVRDAANRDFWTSGHPSMSYDATNDHLYVYGVSTADQSAGVVCFDTAHATTIPFCGYTRLTGPNEAPLPTWVALVSNQMQVGTKIYAFNFVWSGAGPGAQNKVLCFDLATHAACAGQPYAVNIGSGSMYGFVPSPSTAAIGDKLLIPEGNSGLGYGITCFDTTTNATCAGAWPVPTPFGYAGSNGAPYPKLDAAGAIQGFCVPTSTDQCYTMLGATTPTPPGMAGTIGNTTPWNGPSATIGPRVYVADGNRNNQVACYDYSTSRPCPNFPKSFANLGYIYTVTTDPQRPTCLWVNADYGSAQIQSFDAYTGGACGQGAIRVLADQFIVPQTDCHPTAYQSLQIVSPARSAYTSGSIEFDNAGGNPLGIPNLPLDATGSVDLTGLILNGPTGLPQFLINLVGAPSNLGQVTVKLTWTDEYDPSCVGAGIDVVKTATTVTTSLSGDGQNGDHINVLEGSAANDTATIAGNNAARASGTIRYTWYSDNLCSTVAAAGTDLPIATHGTLPPSDPHTFAPGTYYVVASYSGDAGNLAAQTSCGAEVLTVRPLDTTPPSITPVVTGTLGANGWYTSDVTVHWIVSDPESAITSSTGCGDSAVTADIISVAYTCSATSSGGTDSQTVTIKRDATAPTVVPSLPAYIALNSSVSASPGASDATSGIDTASCTPVNTSTTGPKSGTCTATDKAGHTTTAGFSYLVYAGAPGGGSFVIGDQSTTGTVTFWGSQWAKLNTLSGGSAPSAFKGYAKSPSTASCGTSWATDPGNSSPPPAGPLPAYMAVIVTSSASKSGSQISGDTAHVVIVKTKGGYDSNPGHAGTGTVVATIC